MLVTGQAFIHLVLTVTAGHRGSGLSGHPASALARATGMRGLPVVDGHRVGSLQDAYQGMSGQPTISAAATGSPAGRAQGCGGVTASSGRSPGSACWHCWSPDCRGPGPGAPRCRPSPPSTGPRVEHRPRGAERPVIEAGRVANVDTAIAIADRAWLRHSMTVALPAEHDEPGVFSVIGYAFDASSDERTVHVGRYGGQVLSSYGFNDYPLLAKAVPQASACRRAAAWGCGRSGAPPSCASPSAPCASPARRCGGDDAPRGREAAGRAPRAHAAPSHPRSWSCSSACSHCFPDGWWDPVRSGVGVVDAGRRPGRHRGGRAPGRGRPCGPARSAEAASSGTAGNGPS